MRHQDSRTESVIMTYLLLAGSASIMDDEERLEESEVAPFHDLFQMLHNGRSPKQHCKSFVLDEGYPALERREDFSLALALFGNKEKRGRSVLFSETTRVVQPRLVGTQFCTYFGSRSGIEYTSSEAVSHFGYPIDYHVSATYRTPNTE
eukprot:scaffold1498_cov163-Amphora_coffeaeformis.AAC.8